MINWPDPNTQQAISRQFQLQSGLPGIIGSLDGTHIRLSSAPGGDKDYFNRKNFPSIQLQVKDIFIVFLHHLNNKSIFSSMKQTINCIKFVFKVSDYIKL